MSSLESLVKKADNYVMNNEHEKALTYYDKAARKKPPIWLKNQINSRRIRIAERLNKLDKAYSLVNQLKNNDTLDIQKARAIIYYRLKRYDDVISLCNTLLESSIDNGSKAELNFLLANAYDKIKNESIAYEHYKIANQITRSLPKFSQFDKFYSLEYVELMRQNFKELNKVVSNNQDQPVFFVGFPRSGTTLLKTILDSHNDTSLIDEKRTFPVNYRGIVRNPQAAFTGLANMNLEQQASNYKQAIAQYADTSKMVIDKGPIKMTDVALINKIFPNAKFIFMVRHPLDCTLSCFMQDFHINDHMANFFSFEESIYFYDRAMSLWTECQDELDLSAHYIYYEDLINDMEQETKKLTDFLGLDWDPNMSEYYNQNTKTDTPSYSQVSQKPYKSAMNRYQRYGINEDILGNWQKYFGYKD